MIALPSGVRAYLQERLEDNPGGMGVVQRFRYVMPELTKRLTIAPVPDEGGDSLAADLHHLDELDGPDRMELSPVISLPPQAGDSGADPDERFEDALPAAPESLFREPVHDDIIWLCENQALPLIAQSQSRAAQVVISVADRESEFGSYDPAVLQIFEVFEIPADGRGCAWKPW